MKMPCYDDAIAANKAAGIEMDSEILAGLKEYMLLNM